MNQHHQPETDLRLRAEKQIKLRKGEALHSHSELQRLVHELEVHQIELEMQNEELQRARLELEALLDKYTNLYDFAPVGYFTLDRDGSIRQANLTGATLLEEERSLLINRPFIHFVSPPFRTNFSAFLEAVFKSQKNETCQISLQKEGNKGRFLEIEGRALESGGQCRFAVKDISERKAIEEKRRESEEKYQALFYTMTQGVIYLEADGVIVSGNPASEKILGVPLKQLYGKTWPVTGWKYMNEDGSDIPREQQPWYLAFVTGQAVENRVVGTITPGSDRYIWLKITAVPQFPPSEDKPSQVILILENITILKQMAVYNTLTPREKEVFKLMVTTRSRHNIAETLKISPKTFDKHKENLMEKLILHEMEDMILLGKMIGLI